MTGHPTLQNKQTGQQTTQLVMTPRLQQAVKILQASVQDLHTLLTQDLLNNPLLEGTMLPPEGPADSSTRGGGGDDWLNRIPNPSATLHQHVAEHIALEFPQGPERAAAFVILDCLEETGYLMPDYQAVLSQSGISEPLHTKVLERLQKMGPPGVFARSLEECLQLQIHLQLDEKPYLASVLKLLPHLELLGAHKIDNLCQKLGCTGAEVHDMVTLLRTLNPKPGLVFDHGLSSTRVPEVLVQQNVTGAWKAVLNPEAFPKLTLRSDYPDIAQKAGASAQSYISQRHAEAVWLINALEHRATTILHVTQAIIDIQENFFHYGVTYLKPLTLQMIATQIGVHESTVSRASTQKYLACPRGIFELKFFFSSSVEGSNDTTHASHAVRDTIKTLIKTEPQDTPYADDDIVALLAKKGIKIARRTVAKYRDLEGIPSSALRRRQKRWGQG